MVIIVIKICILILIFLTACTPNKEPILKEVSPNIKIASDLTFEYKEEIHLKDVVSTNECELINPNMKLDTSSLGQKNVKFLYKINSQIKTYSFRINVVDTTAPILHISNLTTTVGKEINMLKNAMCGDNYDRKIECHVDGYYDFYTMGEYPLKLVAADSNGNKNERSFKLIVKEKSNSTTQNYYYLEDLIKEHKSNKTMIGIDVSSWQGDIDWQQVKNAGVEFAMIRIGFGQNELNRMTYDSKFKENLKNAKANNIKVGIYFYSHAKNKYDALKQAKWIVEALDGETLALPIAFDWEIWSNFNSYNLNFNDLNEIAKTFLDEIENNGYKAMNYGSAFFLNNIWNTPEYDIWLAHYTDKTNYDKPYYIWQLSNQGKVPGIDGYVDLDVLYKK